MEGIIKWWPMNFNTFSYVFLPIKQEKDFSLTYSHSCFVGSRNSEFLIQQSRAS